MTENASMSDKASDTADAGKEAASEVSSTATEKAKDVAAEAQGQARDLVGEARAHVRGQAGDQQQAAVANLRSLGDELRAMTNGSSDGDQPSGTATHLVGQAADRAHGLADWLDERSPEDILAEARRFAQRKPGVFLLGALAAGVVAGRLARGVAAEHSDDTPSTDSAAAPATNWSSPTRSEVPSTGGSPAVDVGSDAVDPSIVTEGRHADLTTGPGADVEFSDEGQAFR